VSRVEDVSSPSIQELVRVAQKTVRDEIDAVEAEIARHLLAKYNADQPRDSHGRFGSGGGEDAPKVMDWQRSGPPDVSANKARDWMESHIDSVMSPGRSSIGSEPLKNVELAALGHYQKEGHQDLNEHLRAGGSIKDDPDGIGKTIQGAFQHSETNEPVVVFRGLNKFQPDANVGDVFTDRGFPSTSLVEAVSKFTFTANQDENQVMQINLPTGTPAIGLASLESEVLLPAGSQFRVDAKPGAGSEKWVVTYVGQTAVKSLAKTQAGRRGAGSKFAWSEGDIEIAKPAKKSSDSNKFTPPRGVREEARRAVEWIKEGHAGANFTPVGRGRAGDLAIGRSVSLDIIKRMASYLARHEVDKKGKGWSPGEDGYPSPGRVAWAAWGGDPAVSWTNGILKSNNVAKYSPDEERDERGRWTSGGSDGTSSSPKEIADRLAAGKSVTVEPSQVVGIAKYVASKSDPETRKNAQYDKTNLSNLHLTTGKDVFAQGPKTGIYQRAAMPQIPSSAKPAFLESLSKAGIGVTRETISPNDLKPSQRDYSAAGSSNQHELLETKGMFTGNVTPKDGDRILVSKDNYIIDGHHRWAGYQMEALTNTDVRVPVIKIDASRKELIGSGDNGTKNTDFVGRDGIVNKFVDSAGLARAKFGEVKATKGIKSVRIHGGIEFDPEHPKDKAFLDHLDRLGNESNNAEPFIWDKDHRVEDFGDAMKASRSARIAALYKAARKQIAAEIAAVESEVLKYSPDQPRDDHGRFGDGDGSSTTSKFKTWDDVKTWGDKNGIKMDTKGLQDTAHMTPQAMSSVVGRIEAMDTKFPGIKKELSSVGPYESKTALAAVSRGDTGSNLLIAAKTGDAYANPGAYKVAMLETVLPSNNGTPRWSTCFGDHPDDTINHEMGHVVQNMMQREGLVVEPKSSWNTKTNPYVAAASDAGLLTRTSRTGQGPNLSFGAGYTISSYASKSPLELHSEALSLMQRPDILATLTTEQQDTFHAYVDAINKRTGQTMIKEQGSGASSEIIEDDFNLGPDFWKRFYELTTKNLAKYSPDQPRDDHGRFGSGGGDSKPEGKSWYAHILTPEGKIDPYPKEYERAQRYGSMTQEENIKYGGYWGSMPKELQNERGAAVKQKTEEFINRVEKNNSLAGGLKPEDYPSGHLPSRIQETKEGFAEWRQGGVNSWGLRSAIENFDPKVSDGQIRQRLADYMKSHDPSVRMPLSKFSSFIKEGEMKNFAQTNTTSAGTGRLSQVYKEARKEGEQGMLGVPLVTNGDQRPVYGYMAPKNSTDGLDPSRPRDVENILRNIHGVSADQNSRNMDSPLLKEWQKNALSLINDHLDSAYVVVRQGDSGPSLSMRSAADIAKNPGGEGTKYLPLSDGKGNLNYETVKYAASQGEAQNDGYGNVQVVFNRDVLKNATVTDGDTLDSSWAGLHVAIPATMAESADPRLPTVGAVRSSDGPISSNMEVQYFQHPKVQDIAEVKFYGNLPSKAIQNELTSKGIPFSKIEPAALPVDSTLEEIAKQATKDSFATKEVG